MESSHHSKSKLWFKLDSLKHFWIPSIELDDLLIILSTVLPNDFKNLQEFENNIFSVNRVNALKVCVKG